MSNRNNITCGCKIFISDMLLQSDLNKWRLLKMAKLDKFYINYDSTKVFQIFKFDFIKYNNQIFPNNSYINLRACDAVSSYNCQSKITASKIPKWYYILNFCYNFPRVNVLYLESSEQLYFLFPASLQKIKLYIFKKICKFLIQGLRRF